MAPRKAKIDSSAPSADALRVADLLHSAAIHLLRRVRIRDSESGVGPAQLSALSVLVFGGPRSLGELAAAEQVQPPTMSRVVRSLEKARLIRRNRTADRRKIQLEATPKGEQVLQEGRKRRVALLAAALTALPPRDMRKASDAADFLGKLVRGL